MLIRSQDKCDLFDITSKGIVIDLPDDERVHKRYPIKIQDVRGSSYNMGTYLSREKAIKVLDMIQDAYINETRASCNADGFGVVYNQNSVFQMPKDEEVEVDD